MRASSGSPSACSGDMYRTVPDRGAQAGQRARGLVARRGLGRLDHRRQAEVEQLRVPARGDEDVGRLEIAMDDAGGVGGVERVGDLDAEADDGADRHRAGGHHFVQRQAAEQLHDEIGAPVRLRRLADVVDRADVRVIQRRRRARLALEAPQMFFRRGERGRQQLERPRRGRASDRAPDRPRPCCPRRAARQFRNGRQS